MLFSSARSRTCSSARWGVHPTRSGVSTPASATRPRPGAAPAGSWPRSSGIPANSIPGWAFWSPTYAIRPSGALAYNLANFFRTLVLPDEVERWSLTTLREKVVKIGAKVIAHARYTVFQVAEVAVPRDLFRRILAMIDGLRPRRIARC